MFKPRKQIIVLISMILTVCWLALGQSSAQTNEKLIDGAVDIWTGDFDEMLERRQLRALVVYNKLLYFLDGATQRGASYDALEGFRKFVNEKYKLKSREFHIVYIPVNRDQLIPALLDGIGDVAVANLTITPVRQEQVDFSAPLMTGVREVLVTGPTAPEISTLNDLAGMEIHVRPSSSYFKSLESMNERFESEGLESARLIQLDEFLEDGDLLEMVNGSLLPFAVVDSHKATFWADVFDNLVVRDDIVFSAEGSLGWAFRKNSPTLESVMNQYVSQNKKGTLHGNMILNRYLRDNKWVRNALGKKEMKRLEQMINIFKQYAGEYDFDWLMLAALGFQESGLDQNVKSSAGAIGVMQLLPSTAADPNVNIPDIERLENNINAGAKYLRFLRDRYISDSGGDELNQTLLTFASYNAGPAKISKIRKETAERGLDPNVWFGNVEHVVAKNIGRETVQYVSNIYKYYIAYKLVGSQSSEREAAKDVLIETLE